MTENPSDSEILPELSEIDLLEVNIDLYTLNLANKIEKVLPVLVESSDPQQIRETMLRVGRAGFGLGLLAQKQDPKLFDELHNRIRGDKPSDTL